MLRSALPVAHGVCCTGTPAAQPSPPVHGSSPRSHRMGVLPFKNYLPVGREQVDFSEIVLQ